MPNDQSQQASVNPISKKTHIVKITTSVEKAAKTPVKRSKKTPGPVEKAAKTIKRLKKTPGPVEKVTGTPVIRD